MQISSTNAASTATTTSSATSNGTKVAKAATVDYNSFLKLLVAQMKNQDPTAPSDPTAFMAQLASFSNVEQQVEANSKLDQLLTTSALSQAETTIGRTVTSSDGTASGVVVSVALGSDGAATATLANGSTVALGRRRNGQLHLNEADALTLMQGTIWTIAVTSGPAVITAMVVGIIIALFQALTQVQEMTLTFVPKIVAVLFVLALTASFIGSQIFIFTEQVYARIETER